MGTKAAPDNDFHLVHFRNSNKKILVGKSVESDGTVIQLSLDEEGNSVDYSLARKSDGDLFNLRFGNQSPRLRHAMDESKADSFSVTIWMKEPDAPPVVPKVVDGTLAEAQQSAFLNQNRQGEMRSKRQKRIGKVFSDLADALGKAHRTQRFAELDAVSFSADPFFTVKLARDELAILKHHPAIASIELVYQDPIIYDLAGAANTMSVNILHNNGIDGTGIKVGVWHRNFPNYISQMGSPTYRIPSGSADQHLAYIIASIRNSRTFPSRGRGFSPGVSLFVANYSTQSDDQAAFDWARSNQLRALNQSWHTLSEETNGDQNFNDRKGDYYCRNFPYMVLVQAAGNIETNPNIFVVHKGYNNIVVGSDLQTSAIGPNSVWRNPNSGQELPHLTAGVDQTMSMFEDASGNAQITANGGTSVAAALMTGFVADLIQMQPRLSDKPEAIRAILMASAVNIQGGNWFTDRYIDAKDGAGRPNAIYANLSAIRPLTTGTGGANGYYYGNFQPSNSSYSFDAQLDANSTICLSWTAEITGTNFTNTMLPDLDLVVLKNGSMVASSVSSFNPEEILYLQNVTPGTYTIRVLNYSMMGSSSVFWSVAWNSH